MRETNNPADSRSPAEGLPVANRALLYNAAAFIEHHAQRSRDPVDEACLDMMPTPLRKLGDALDALATAVRDAGPHPEYHRAAIESLQTGWPTLWSAIQQLLQTRQSDA